MFISLDDIGLPLIRFAKNFWFFCSPYPISWQLTLIEFLPVIFYMNMHVNKYM